MEPDKEFLDANLLVTAVEEARKAYVAAKIQENIARGATCDALNRLNQCQKDLDVFMNRLHTNAPYESNWRKN